MLKEALEFLDGQSNSRVHPISIDDLRERNTTTVLVDGTPHEFKHAVPARRHNVNDLESLSEVVESFGGELNSTVWHHGDVVVAVLNDGHDSYRDDSVRWSLRPSAKWEAVTTQASGPREHKAFVRWLVEHLRDEFETAAPGLLGTIRTLKFSLTDHAEGNVQQGRESMGREINQEIAGAKDLPETVTLQVKRWADLDYTATVECLFILDVAERKLSLRPLADQLKQAENAAQKWLGEQLENAVECPVYYGTP